MNLDHSPGRKLLFESGYDLRTSTYFSPSGNSTGIDLSDEPRIRSDFQRAIGEQNLEHQLNKLSKDTKILASIAEMQKDIRDGNRGKYESRDYYHNIRIGRLFHDARRIAWAKISQEPHVQRAIQAQLNARIDRVQKKEQTSLLNEVQPLLQYQPK